MSMRKICREKKCLIDLMSQKLINEKIVERCPAVSKDVNVVNRLVSFLKGFSRLEVCFALVWDEISEKFRNVIGGFREISRT
jgi:hypothetical protein